MQERRTEVERRKEGEILLADPLLVRIQDWKSIETSVLKKERQILAGVQVPILAKASHLHGSRWWRRWQER
jgi:hypothetical protein